MAEKQSPGKPNQGEGQAVRLDGEQSPDNLDLRGKVPDLVPYLLPGEQVVDVSFPPIKESRFYPSALKALKQLAGSERVSEIGGFGPTIASRVVEENKEVADLRLFEVLFGRDSLRVALDVSSRFPQLLRTTVLRLAELQGIKDDTYSEEQPGRIVHEVRNPKTDPIAQRLTREHGWHWPYYATVDATPMFVSAVVRCCENFSQEGDFLRESYVGKDGHEHVVADALKASLNWMKRRMDSNPEGLLEFKRMFEGSHLNQSWKDSGDSYHHKDGTIASHDQGIASIEVQALAYDALLDATDLYERLGYDDAEIKGLKEQAKKLQERVMEIFWVEDERGGYFALGTDRDDAGNIRSLEVRTSNMGHLLNSRILEGDEPEVVARREAVIRALFSPEMLNASGIRTLSNREKRFRPGAYHNGNVWLWDTYYISQGLERQGYYGLAWELNRRIWSVVNKFKKFPEFARGGEESEPALNSRVVDLWDKTTGQKNRIEQPPQEIQAWSVAALLCAKYKYADRVFRRGAAVPETAVDSQKRELEKEIFSALA